MMGDLLSWLFAHHENTVQDVVAYGIMLVAVVLIGSLCLSITLIIREGVRQFKGRNKSISLSRHTWLAFRKGGAGLKREIVWFIADKEKARAFVRELGSWPPVWKYKMSGDYLLKARHYSAQHAYNNAPQKAACITGIAWFLLILLGGRGTGGDNFIAACIFAAVCGGLSWPVWWRFYQSKLNFTFSGGVVEWQGRDKRGTLAAAAKIEVLAMPHPQAEEELRVFQENLRTGAISPKTKFRPVYARASQLVALSGYEDRDWQVIADMADDPRGRRAYKVKTAIEFVRAKNIVETLARDSEEAAQEQDRFR